MSAITIDKQSALVLIDPQQGILAPPARPPSSTRTISRPGASG